MSASVAGGRSPALVLAILPGADFFGIVLPLEPRRESGNLIKDPQSRRSMNCTTAYGSNQDRTMNYRMDLL